MATVKTNRKNNVYDIFKSINKYSDRLFASGVHLDTEKQCKVYTDGYYCIIENCLIADTTKTIDKDNNIIDCNYPNYLKVLNCKNDINKNDFYLDCFIKELEIFDKLVKERKDNENRFVHFDIFSNKEKQIVLNQQLTKKLSYWVKCHKNINILFECFDNDNARNYVHKIKLFDDKNNQFIAMCSNQYIYECLYSPDTDDTTRQDYINETVFMTNY